MELLGQSDLGLSLAGLMNAKQPHLVREVSDLIKHHGLDLLSAACLPEPRQARQAGLAQRLFWG
jgi:hypothetical protein